jgi:hypothetical protein
MLFLWMKSRCGFPSTTKYRPVLPLDLGTGALQNTFHLVSKARFVD